MTLKSEKKRTTVLHRVCYLGPKLVAHEVGFQFSPYFNPVYTILAQEIHAKK